MRCPFCDVPLVPTRIQESDVAECPTCTRTWTESSAVRTLHAGDGIGPSRALGAWSAEPLGPERPDLLCPACERPELRPGRFPVGDALRCSGCLGFLLSREVARRLAAATRPAAGAGSPVRILVALAILIGVVTLGTVLYPTDQRPVPPWVGVLVLLLAPAFGWLAHRLFTRREVEEITVDLGRPRSTPTPRKPFS